METIIPYSALRTAPRQPFAEVLPLSAPWSIYVEPTNVCNFKCRFCPESFGDYQEIVGGHRRMDMGLYRKLVDDIAALGQLKVLRFYMLGEPLAHPQLAEMIRIATDAGIAQRTELTTNATLLTEARARELLTSGLTYLRVSVYAVDPARHAHVTQSRIPVERIHANVSGFRQLRDAAGATLPRLYVKIIDTFTEENDRFRQLYTDIADEVEIERPMNWNEYEGRDLLAGAYDQLANVAGERAHDHDVRKNVCPFPFYTLVIHANGDVSVCCVDWSKKAVVGNVTRSSLREIWLGPEMREFQRMHLEGRRHENEACRNCTYLHTSPDSLEGLTALQRRRILREDPSA